MTNRVPVHVESILAPIEALIAQAKWHPEVAGRGVMDPSLSLVPKMELEFSHAQLRTGTWESCSGLMMTLPKTIRDSLDHLRVGKSSAV